MISTKVHAQTQHTKIKITIGEYTFILPYNNHQIIEIQCKGFKGCCSLSI